MECSYHDQNSYGRTLYRRLLIRKKRGWAMEIKLQSITIKEIANGYLDNDEEGVIGYNGKII